MKSTVKYHPTSTLHNTPDTKPHHAPTNPLSNPQQTAPSLSQTMLFRRSFISIFTMTTSKRPSPTFPRPVLPDKPPTEPSPLPITTTRPRPSILLSPPTPNRISQQSRPQPVRRTCSVAFSVPHPRPSQIPETIHKLPPRFRRVAKAAYHDHIETLYRRHSHHPHLHTRSTHHTTHPSNQPHPQPQLRPHTHATQIRPLSAIPTQWHGSYPPTSSILLPVQTSRYSSRIAAATGLYICPQSATNSDGTVVMHSPSHGDVVAIDWAEGGSGAPRLLYTAEESKRRKSIRRERECEVNREQGVERNGRKEVGKRKGKSKARSRSWVVIGRKGQKHGFDNTKAGIWREEWEKTMRTKWHPQQW